MIYKDNSVYKQGLTLDDVKDYIASSGFEDVTNRIGTVLNGNLIIRYNKVLNMCSINIWNGFTYGAKVTLFEFNSDFMGSWAGPAIVSRLEDSNGVPFVGTCNVRWGTTPQWISDNEENRIFVRNAQLCSAYCLFPLNNGFNLQDYLDAH